MLTFTFICLTGFRYVESRNKRVICDSDDDDEVPTPQEVKPSISSEGWLEKRDVGAMTNAEILANKKAALASRTTGSNKPIPKKRRMMAESEDEDSDVSVSSNVESSYSRSKNDYLPYSIQEDNLSVLTERRAALGRFAAARRLEKVNARASRASNRSGGAGLGTGTVDREAAGGRGSATRKRVICVSDDDDEPSGEAKEMKSMQTKPTVHVIDSDGDSADDAAGDGVYSNWRDPEGGSDDDEENYSAKKLAAMDARHQGEVEKRSSQVLQRCLDLSQQLRSELRSWGGSSATATSGEHSADASSGELEMGDCVNLTTMSVGMAQSPSTIIRDDADHEEEEEGAGEGSVDLKKLSSGQPSKLISQAALVSFCPDLVLKDYQLVGINWLKLLHSKDVNGVLADDMGLGYAHLPSFHSIFYSSN